MNLVRECLDPASGLELIWRLYDHGATVRIGAGSQPVVSLIVWVARPVRFTITVRGDRSWQDDWDLEPDRASRRGRREPFGGLAEPDCPPAARRRLRDRLRAIEAAVVRRCDPHTRALALRYRPDVRFPVYRKLVTDRTGRLAQLVEACPGALALALALDDQGGGTPAAGERLLGRVRDGIRLDRALDEALGDPDVAWRWNDGRGEPADPDGHRRLATQRLLVRRAGPRVPGHSLLGPPPLAFAPEDIPTTPRDNARWYHVMQGSGDVLTSYPRRARLEVEALARLVSAQVEALVRAPPRGLPPRTKLMMIRDYLVACRLRPPRSRSVASLLGEARRWHRELDRPLPRDPDEYRPGPDFLEVSGLSPDQPLPLLADVAPGGGNLAIRALDTVGALQAEGRRLHHCVVTRAPEALAGQCYLFAAEIAGESLTLELLPRGSGLRVGDARGSCNREPTQDEWEALAPWLDSMKARRDWH